MKNYNTVDRLNWLDLAKGINILLVIIGHTAVKDLTWIYSFHMPLFAVLTGFTIRQTDTIDALKKQVMKDLRRLILPFFICLFVDEMGQCIIWGDDMGECCLNFFWNIFYMQSDGKHIFTIWFLVALFWAKLFFYSVTKYCDKPLPCILLLLVIGMKFSRLLPIYMGKGFVLLFFIYIGFNLSKYYDKFLSFIEWIAIITLLCFMYLRGIGSWCSISDQIYSTGIWDILTATAGSVFFITVVITIENNIFCVLENIGRHTLIIMCVHHLDKYFYEFERTFINLRMAVVENIERILLVLGVAYMLVFIKYLWQYFCKRSEKVG